MSRRITRAALAVTAAAAALALSACSSSEAPSSATGGGSGKQRTIAFIPGCTCDPYYSTEITGFEAAAKAAGVTPIVQGPANFQASEQIPVLQAVVQKKPDAIVIDPTDATALAAPIAAAVAQGIPVMTTGNNVNSDKIFTAIAASSVQGGKLGAEELMKQKPEGGKVVFVHIKPGISSIDDREKGFRQAFDGQSKYKVLSNLYAGNDSATQAAGLVQSAITANPDLVAIFASNVITAEGAANAVRAAGKTGKIAVLGYDASPQEATNLKNGTLTALVSQNPYQIGQLAVKNALKYIDGDHNIPKDQPLVPLVITKDNLDDPASQTGLYK
ncbi:substrate-binding domain-containing protein [Streptomyces sp. NBC_00873]|uniref:substrate-binding domain-containing protein n=1 Tax=unclassified Streptomyces TaxID=2593676 RepID=UPI00386BA079|nr:substrate-binding domain-containing protein [Streptomyces sp. NBC_00873]WTA42173.1 substrate-binding domain-containing protein [Streptomyces sp. NBC_00842]